VPARSTPVARCTPSPTCRPSPPGCPVRRCPTVPTRAARLPGTTFADRRTTSCLGPLPPRAPGWFPADRRRPCGRCRPAKAVPREPVDASVPAFVCVTTHYPRSGAGILTCFPFDSQYHPKKAPVQTEFSYLLGSTHPCPITVHMEPFSTSVFKVLI